MSLVSGHDNRLLQKQVAGTAANRLRAQLQADGHIRAADPPPATWMPPLLGGTCLLRAVTTIVLLVGGVTDRRYHTTIRDKELYPSCF